jgi:hypothetical protein
MAISRYNGNPVLRRVKLSRMLGSADASTTADIEVHPSLHVFEPALSALSAELLTLIGSVEGDQGLRTVLVLRSSTFDLHLRDNPPMCCVPLIKLLRLCRFCWRGVAQL